MGHGAVRPRPVPVPLAGRDRDQVAGPGLPHRLAVLLEPAGALDDLEQLGAAVGVPVGAGPGLERHAVDVRGGRVRHPVHAGQPGAAHERLRVRRLARQGGEGEQPHAAAGRPP